MSGTARSDGRRSDTADAALEVTPVLSAYRQIADELRSKILSGRLVPGDKLPSEFRLSQMFGVSRATVREALRTLTTQGLLETSRGARGGSFVASPDPTKIAADVSSGLARLVASPELSVDNLLEMRLLNEPAAAALAAERASDEALKNLVDSVTKSAPDSRPIEEFAHHVDFHESLLRASGNTLLAMVCRLVGDVLRARLPRTQVDADFWSLVHRGHVEVAEAIADRNGPLAQLRMRDHLEEVAPYYRGVGAAEDSSAEGRPETG